MLTGLGVAGGEGVRAAAGTGWAAAVVPPSASEPTCGADVYHDGADVLLWAGEMVLPESAAPLSTRDTPARAISRWLLAGLRCNGIETAARLDGAFHGAWYDGRRRQWTVFNDRLGLLPLFWSAGENELVVGPRAWLTWQATGRPLEIDAYGVADLLRTQNMVDDRTLIRGVHWLKRRHALEWNSRAGATCRPVWDLDYAIQTFQTDDAAIEGYLEAMRSSLRRCADTRGPLLLGISGGLDSRILLGLCAELGRVPACFTTGLLFGNDVRFGRQLARVAGAAHEWVPLDEGRLTRQLTTAIVETDGLLSAAHLAPAAAVRDYLRGHTGAVLLEGFFNGLIGGSTVPADDDVRGGHPPHQHRWAQGMLHAGGPMEQIDHLLEPRLAEQNRSRWAAHVDCAYHRAPYDDPLRKVEYVLAGARMGRIDTVGTALLRHDVLVRNPAADAALLHWHQHVPARLRRGRRLYPELIRRHFPRLARISRSENGGLPIAAGFWRREICWQREKLYRWWAGRRYPVLRRWGADGQAIRAWTFQTWRASGELDMLMAPDARILAWVRCEALRDLWTQATADPLQGGPLLGLATIEVMVRWLEDQSHQRRTQDMPSIRFEIIEAGDGHASDSHNRIEHAESTRGPLDNVVEVSP